MAIKQNSDGNSKQRVEEGVEPSCREGTDAGPCERIQLRKSDGHPSCCSDKGPSTGNQDINKDICGMVKSYKLNIKRNKSNQDSLSDIDDAEVAGYLNTKAKKQKTTETKKGVSVKKAAKTTEKVDQKPSSRINYDALKLLNDELNQGSETSQIVGADSSYAHRTENSPYGNISHHGSNEGSYNEVQYDISSSRDDETLVHRDGEMYNEYGDEQLDDEYFDF
ncbi:hypothetical protein DH2020_006027 [Rehmannia glutinosa]|uniref:Uncharacterized protein n=1 Tax=Rehmannia glutinosa TaxID=99300 RepID=A0ABR0XI96_REHGL